MSEEQFKNEVKRRWGQNEEKGRRLAGVFFLLVGGALLARAFGVDLPFWLFKWPMILIMIGLFIGLKHGFRTPAPFVLLLIGGVFLSEYIMEDRSLRPYLWPAIFLGIGAIILLRPKGKRCRRDEWFEPLPASPTSNTTEPGDTAFAHFDDKLDITAVFGGIKKKVLSKNFRGGDVVAVMGGCEVDLTQADFKGRVTLECVAIFGGMKLIIPPDWNVQSEVVAIFGGVEDKRSAATNYDPQKVIYLEGTCMFGGIEIKSY